MDNFIKRIGFGRIILLGFLLTLILRALSGAFVGWLVGLFLEREIHNVLIDFGMDNPPEIWVMGAVLGLILSFFKWFL